MGIRILGTGSALPERIMTNAELSKTVDTNDAWIRERTGIGARHIAGEDESVATLGAKAAMKAMEMAGLAAEEIDLILLATCSADDNTPSAACILQGLIGAKHAAAIDINAACTGFLTCLTMADAYFRTGNFQKILVVGSETLSRIVDWTDRGTCILFGDGAGAVVLSPDENSDFTYVLGADGEKKDSLICNKCDKIKMDGKAIYRFATMEVPKCIEDTLKKADLSADQIDFFLLHQANRRIIEAVAKRLGLDIDRFPMNMEQTGNMSSASIPVLLDEQVRSGAVKSKDRIVMSGFGAGLTYGACVFNF